MARKNNKPAATPAPDYVAPETETAIGTALAVIGDNSGETAPVADDDGKATTDLAERLSALLGDVKPTFAWGLTLGTQAARDESFSTQSLAYGILRMMDEAFRINGITTRIGAHNAWVAALSNGGKRANIQKLARMTFYGPAVSSVDPDKADADLVNAYTDYLKVVERIRTAVKLAINLACLGVTPDDFDVLTHTFTFGAALLVPSRGADTWSLRTIKHRTGRVSINGERNESLFCEHPVSGRSAYWNINPTFIGEVAKHRHHPLEAVAKFAPETVKRGADVPGDKPPAPGDKPPSEAVARTNLATAAAHVSVADYLKEAAVRMQTLMVTDAPPTPAEWIAIANAMAELVKVQDRVKARIANATAGQRPSAGELQAKAGNKPLQASAA